MKAMCSTKLNTNVISKFTGNQLLPRFAVCLAAYNGMPYVSEQLDSILAQQGVAVTVFASVDVSSDGTEAWVDMRSRDDIRIIVLPHGKKFGSAAKNFFRTLHEVDFSAFDYVAFADQDDIWLLDKLSRAHEILLKTGADAYSSNVMAFWPNGKKKLIVKSQPQKQLDYLFESAGPGCTFLMTPWLVNKVREQLLDANSPAKDMVLHDWLTYAICRANGRKWVIDDKPSLMYRQHGNNVVGANIGLKAKWGRLLKLKQHWYRNEIIKVAKLSQCVHYDAKVAKLIDLLESKKLFSKVKLLAYVPQARRSALDRLMLGCAILLGVF